MTINLAEQGLEGRLIRDIDDLKRDLRELKAKQLIGADSVLVEGSNLFSLANSFTNGQTRVYRVTFTPSSALLTTPDLRWTLYVGTALDNNFAVPSGASLTTDQKAYAIEEFRQWGASSDALGIRIWDYRITANTIAGPYTAHFYGKSYAAKNPGATA